MSAPIEATRLSATSAELGLGLGQGLGLDSLSHSSSHALPFFSQTSFHTLAFSPVFRIYININKYKILFRNGNLTLALAGWCLRLWARSGCGGSGWAPGWCGWSVSSLLLRCYGGAV
jgi:hypothetical protein